MNEKKLIDLISDYQENNGNKLIEIKLFIGRKCLDLCCGYPQELFEVLDIDILCLDIINVLINAYGDNCDVVFIRGI